MNNNKINNTYQINTHNDFLRFIFTTIDFDNLPNDISELQIIKKQIKKIQICQNCISDNNLIYDNKYGIIICTNCNIIVDNIFVSDISYDRLQSYDNYIMCISQFDYD
jgi:hypothetical protein